MRSEFETRREIVEIGRRLWERRYVASNDGNISARVHGGILVTPTGVSKGFMEPADLVLVSRKGERLSGALAPTSELPMHLAVYEMRDDVDAVVHAHPPKATGFAVAGQPLAQCVLPEVILTLGQVPLAEYATPSTDEVVRGQVSRALAGLDQEQARRCVLAYEPIWAIGSGRPATPAEANRVIALSARGAVADDFGEQAAQRTRVLYGGSVLPDNIAAFTAMPEIDGALVGGASLGPEFVELVLRASPGR